MTVSIIIPNFNKEDYIEATLLSVQKQSYSDWEAIIVDDNSTDKSKAIIEKFASQDSRFVLITNGTNENGASVCRNIGLSHANGQFIIFLDSDDILLDTCLQNRIQYMLKEPDLDFAVFPLQTFTHRIENPGHTWDPAKTRNHLLAFLRHQLPWQTMCPIYRKVFLDKIGAFDPRFKRFDDVELHTRALLAKNVKYSTPIAYPPDCFYFVGQDRMTFNFDSITQRVFDDTKLYITHFTQLLHKQQRFRPPYSNHLKGTVFAFFKQLYIHYFNGEIDKEKKEFYSKSLFEATEIIQLLNKRDIFFLRIYTRLSDLLQGKVKGFNFFMRKIFIYLI